MTDVRRSHASLEARPVAQRSALSMLRRPSYDEYRKSTQQRSRRRPDPWADRPAGCAGSPIRADRSGGADQRRSPSASTEPSQFIGGSLRRLAGARCRSPSSRSAALVVDSRPFDTASPDRRHDRNHSTGTAHGVASDHGPRPVGIADRPSAASAVAIRRPATGWRRAKAAKFGQRFQLDQPDRILLAIRWIRHRAGAFIGNALRRCLPSPVSVQYHRVLKLIGDRRCSPV